MTWLESDPSLLYNFADMFVMTLPAPRARYYQDSNYDVIQRNVLTYTNQVVEALGFYPINA